MIQFSALLFLLLGSGTAFAEPVAGELFGFKIGTIYPLTEAVENRISNTGYFREVVPSRKGLPDDIEHFKLFTTVGSSTIVSIWTENKFRTDWDADQFAKKYVALFTQKYGSPGLDKTIDYERYRAVIGKHYLLTINIFLEDDRSAMNVIINMKDNRGDQGPLVRLADREWNDAVKSHAIKHKAKNKSTSPKKLRHIP